MDLRHWIFGHGLAALPLLSGIYGGGLFLACYFVWRHHALRDHRRTLAWALIAATWMLGGPAALVIEQNYHQPAIPQRLTHYNWFSPINGRTDGSGGS